MLASTPVIVDLLALYTPNAASAHGGASGIASLIQGAVDSMNQSLINSEISLAVRLVRTEQITYTGSNNLQTDLDRLRNPSDGFMDSAHTLRNTWGADVVTLITDGASIGGGIANLLTTTSGSPDPTLAFSAIADNSIGPANLTLAHEIGHNLGGGHERGNPNPGQGVVGPFPYSYGYRYTVNDSSHNNVTYHDIMSYSYAPDVELPYFANPNVTVEGGAIGKPAGDPNEADLASTFLVTAPIVAGYRTTNVVTDTTAPTASLLGIDRTGASITFTVRYRDEAGLDLTTIDSNDILVTGPGGWSLPATLLGVDHVGVAGSFKIATYRVLLPATNPSNESLSFVVRPNALRDLSNNYVANAAMAKNTAHVAGNSYGWSRDIGSLANGSSHTEYGYVDDGAINQVYKFTLSSAATVSARLTGLSADANLYLASDTNLDGIFQNGELKWSGFETGTTNEGYAANLTAGTYYAWVFRNAATPFTMSLQAYTDTTAPTASLDITDLRAAGVVNHDFAVTWSDDFDINGDSARFDAGILLDGSATSGWSFYLWPDGALNSVRANAKSRTVYYRLNRFGSGNPFDSSFNGTYIVSILPNALRVKDGAGNLISPVTIGSFKIQITSADTAGPTATLSATAPVAGQTTWDFDVSYKDNTALNAATFDGSDIRVTGPGGFNQLASVVSISSAPSIGTQRTVTYRVTFPGGFWDGTDEGTYTVSLQASQVADPTGNFAASGSLGTVVTSMPNVVAQAGAVAFNGTNNPELLRLDRDASFTYFNLNDTTLWYVPNASVPRAIVNALNGNDTIYAQSGSISGAVNGGTGTNTLNVTGGTLTLDTDAASALGVSVSSGATLNMTASQRFTALAVSGNATLSTGGTKTIVSPTVTVSGQLDLTDNDLIVTYSSVSPIGTWNGSAYDQLTGLVASGKLRSSLSDGSGYTMLGIAEAANVLDFSSSTTALFSGQTVDATTVLVKYTYGGDANLSGNVDIDDYGQIDFNASTGGVLKGWYNGDFDLNGIQDIDDYGIIDFVVGIQGPPI